MRTQPMSVLTLQACICQQARRTLKVTLNSDKLRPPYKLVWYTWAQLQNTLLQKEREVKNFFQRQLYDTDQCAYSYIAPGFCIYPDESIKIGVCLVTIAHAQYNDLLKR